MTTTKVVLHSLAGPPGSRLARRLERTASVFGPMQPIVGPFPRPVLRISASTDQLDAVASGLPEGAARPEALAVRLRRAGAELEWGPPLVVPDLETGVRLSRARGASSVELVRADPSLLTEMQIGSYFNAYWRHRVLRRMLSRSGLPASTRFTPSAAAHVAVDAAFWSGVRSAATNREWQRLANSSYLVFYYHGIADERSDEHAHLSVRPRRFERQLRVLQALGLRALAPDELLRFHSDPTAIIGGRRYVLAADDGISGTVDALRRHGRLDPQVFVCTRDVGASAWWSDDSPLASWDDLREFAAAGGHVGSHSRGHTPLIELDADVLARELRGARSDLESQLPRAIPLLAYPHGIHDERVREQTIAAGYRGAFTTEPGRNGAGTDVYCLRRIELKDWDGVLLLVWTAMTGEPLPWAWERTRRRLKRVRASGRDARAPRRTSPS